MTAFLHDPEVPSGYQDADIEQAEWYDEGRRMELARAAGRCMHQSWVGMNHDGKGPLEGGNYYSVQIGLSTGQVVCTEGCGRVFDSEDDLYSAHSRGL